MARHEGFLSDITGDPLDPCEHHFHLSIWVDRVPDQAGGMENVYESYDMSPKDVEVLLMRLTSVNAPDSRDTVLRHLRAMKDLQRGRKR